MFLGNAGKDTNDEEIKTIFINSEAFYVEVYTLLQDIQQTVYLIKQIFISWESVIVMSLTKEKVICSHLSHLLSKMARPITLTVGRKICCDSECGCGRQLRFRRDRKFSSFPHRNRLTQPHAFFVSCE